MKLFIYDHCPFSVKARMIFALKHIPFEHVILLYDDEKTPINMIGKKGVPILQKTDGTYLPESMDIVNYIDSLSGSSVLTGRINPVIKAVLSTIFHYINRLLLPRYANADLAELKTTSARDAFTHKKETLLGCPFTHLFHETPELLQKLTKDLVQLDPLILSVQACNGKLSEDDFHLFALLRSLTIIKPLQLTKNIKNYLNNMSEKTNIPLFDSLILS